MAAKAVTAVTMAAGAEIAAAATVAMEVAGAAVKAAAGEMAVATAAAGTMAAAAGADLRAASIRERGASAPLFYVASQLLRIALIDCIPAVIIIGTR